MCCRCDENPDSFQPLCNVHPFVAFGCRRQGRWAHFNDELVPYIEATSSSSLRTTPVYRFLVRSSANRWPIFTTSPISSRLPCFEFSLAVDDCFRVLIHTSKKRVHSFWAAILYLLFFWKKPMKIKFYAPVFTIFFCFVVVVVVCFCFSHYFPSPSLAWMRSSSFTRVIVDFSWFVFFAFACRVRTRKIKRDGIYKYYTVLWH